MQNAATANGNGTSLNVLGYATAIVSLTGTWSATVNFEVSTDDTTWVAVIAERSGDYISNPPIQEVASQTGDYIISCAGFKSVRARISGYASGSVTATGYALTQAVSPRVSYVVAAGLNGLKIQDGGNTITVDNGGTFAVQVSSLPASTNTIEVVGDVAQDAAAAGNPVLLGGRASAAAPTDMSADGDSVYLWTTLKGALNIADAGGSITVDNGGTFAVQVSSLPASTNTIEVVGDVAQDAAVGGNPVLLGGRASAAAPTDMSADGDSVYLWTTLKGALNVADGGGSLTVDGTVAVTNSDLTTLAGAIRAEDVASADAHTGMVVMATRKATPANTSGTDGDYEMLQMSAGRLWVDASGVTLTVGSHAVTNAGTFAVQVDGSALTALQKIDDPVLVDDAAFTPATSSVMMAGFEADETSTDSVDEGDAGAARMTLDRKVIVNPQPHTAGGLSIFRSLDLDETEEDVKTSAGQVYGWAVTNNRTSTLWLKFYNATAANTTVGSTTPVITWGIPGNSSDDVAANVMGAHGIAFDTAICVAATTGLADADTGAPAANDLVVNIFYK